MVGTTTLGLGIVAGGYNAGGGLSPITESALASGDLETPGTSFVTSSITPTANRLVVCALHMYSKTPVPTVPTVTGNSLTWVHITHHDYQVLSFEHETVFLFRALGGSPTTGTVTVTTNEQWEILTYSIAQFANVDTSGTNGSGAIVASYLGNAGGATTQSVTYVATASNNAAYIAIGQTFTGPINPTGPGSPQEIHDLATAGIAFETQWVTGTSITTMSGSWGGASASGAVGLEIKNG